MEKKIIIHNYADISDLEAINCVKKVIESGKISKNSKGEQYCFITTFKSGCVVMSDARNTENKNTFSIYKGGECK